MPFQSRITNVPNMLTFINALADFAIANGSFTDEGTLVGGVRILKRGDIYWCMYPSGPMTYNYSSPSPMLSRMTYVKPTTLAEVGTVPGQYSFTVFAPWKGAGPYISFYLFQQGHAVHGVLEVLPNVFLHYSFGVINKNGAFEGGEYITSHAPFYNAAISGAQVFTFYGDHTKNVYPFDGGYGEFNQDEANRPCARPGWMRHIQGGVKNNNASDFGPIGQGAYLGKNMTMVSMAGAVSNQTASFGLNNFNLRSPIFPVYVRSRDVSNPSVAFHLGEVPGVGYLKGRLIPEAGMVDLTWQVFPIGGRENPPDGSQYQTTTNKSLAYLRA